MTGRHPRTLMGMACAIPLPLHFQGSSATSPIVPQRKYDSLIKSTIVPKRCHLRKPKPTHHRNRQPNLHRVQAELSGWLNSPKHRRLYLYCSVTSFCDTSSAYLIAFQISRVGDSTHIDPDDSSIFVNPRVPPSWQSRSDEATLCTLSTSGGDGDSSSQRKHRKLNASLTSHNISIWTPFPGTELSMGSHRIAVKASMGTTADHDLINRSRL